MGWLWLWWALRRERRRERERLWGKEPGPEFGVRVVIWGIALVLAIFGVLVSMWLWFIALLIVGAAAPFLFE